MATRRSNDIWGKANEHDQFSLVEDAEADKHGMAILSATDGIIP